MSNDTSDASLLHNPYLTVNASFEGSADDELTLKAGDVVAVLSTDENIAGGEGWWVGKKGTQLGVFPSSLIEFDAKLKVRRDEFSYENSSLIGVGGFSSVFKGTFKDTIAAIKVLNVSVSEDPNVVKKSLIHEANLASTLSHKNIVGLLGVCFEHPFYCLLMDFCAGGGLDRIIYNNFDIPPSILLEWAKQIASGVKYLHGDCGVCILHRDLKSANVLIKEPVSAGIYQNKTLKITDFGLASKMTSYCDNSEINIQKGTSQWMSPEVIFSSNYSKASDIWAYGVVLWELVFGRKPFQHHDASLISFRIAKYNERLPIPQEDQVLYDLFKGCWMDNPENRWKIEMVLNQLDILIENILTDENYDSDFFFMRESWWNQLDSEVLQEEIRQYENATDMYAEAYLLWEKVSERERIIQRRELDLVKASLMPLIENSTKSQKKRKKRPKFSQISSSNISFPREFQHVISVQYDPTNTQTTSYRTLCNPEVNKSRTWGPNSVKKRNNIYNGVEEFNEYNSATLGRTKKKDASLYQLSRASSSDCVTLERNSNTRSSKKGFSKIHRVLLDAGEALTSVAMGKFKRARTLNQLPNGILVSGPHVSFYRENTVQRPNILPVNNNTHSSHGNSVSPQSPHYHRDGFPISGPLTAHNIQKNNFDVF